MGGVQLPLRDPPLRRRLEPVVLPRLGLDPHYAPLVHLHLDPGVEKPLPHMKRRHVSEGEGVALVIIVRSRSRRGAVSRAHLRRSAPRWTAGRVAHPGTPGPTSLPTTSAARTARVGHRCPTSGAFAGPAPGEGRWPLPQGWLVLIVPAGSPPRSGGRWRACGSRSARARRGRRGGRRGRGGGGRGRAEGGDEEELLVGELGGGGGGGGGEVGGRWGGGDAHRHLRAVMPRTDRGKAIIGADACG